jgi:hypothetical protein
MSYEKLTTYLESKSIDIRDVEDDFRLVCENGSHRIEIWNTDKLGAQPSMDTISGLSASTLPKVRGDRRMAYASIEEQLDMQYWDAINGTNKWREHVAKVKSDIPKE